MIEIETSLEKQHRSLFLFAHAKWSLQYECLLEAACRAAIARNFTRPRRKDRNRIALNNVEAGRLQAQLVLNSVPKGSEVAIIE